MTNLLKNVCFALMFAAINCVSLELTINTAIENKEPYCVVNLLHEEPFSCRQNVDVYGKSVDITCIFDKSPANKFTKSENLFFKISSDVKNDKFVVILVPKKSAHLQPITGELKSGLLVWDKRAESSKKWQIVGYDKNMPFVTPKRAEGINFPIAITTHNTPAIGALDIAKKPLEFEEGRDVPVFLAIKKEIETESFAQALYDSDDAIKSFPNSIFTKEFLFYKAKALFNLPHLEREEDLIEIGRAWIKQYPADEAVSEMLLMLAVTYNKLGLANESNYYFDRIFTEHVGEKHEKLAKIAFGDIQLQKGNTQRGLEYYDQALSETDDLLVASIAAMKIAQKQLENQDVKLAAKNYEKVLNANPEFMFKEKAKAYELANMLAEKNSYHLASKLAEGIKKRTESQEEMHDNAFKDAAYWMEMSGDKNGAYKMYKEYLGAFPNGGAHEQFVKERLDRLFFEIGDENKSALLGHYETLMKEYPGGEVYQKALLQKAKLYFEDKNYSAVLGMKKELSAIKDDESGSLNKEAIKVLKDSAKVEAQSALNRDECRVALSLKLEYNISIDAALDKKMFDCAKRGAIFSMAEEIAKSHLEEKEIKERMFWLYEMAKVYLLTKDFTKAKSVANDAFELAFGLKESRYYDVLIELAIAQKESGDFEGLLNSVKKIEELLPKNPKNIELFKGVSDAALKKKDDVMGAEYAKKALKLQKDLGVNLYSPALDIVYAESLIRLNMFDGALSVLDGIDTKSAASEHLVKIHYWSAFIYQKQQKQQQAKDSYQKCSETNSSSPWVGVCKDALKLFEQ